MAIKITSYAYTVDLKTPYAGAIENVKAALAEEGFGVLTEIDVKATLQAKLGKPFRDYIILGACNPQLAHQALSLDLDVGLLLPCNVVVRAEGEGSTVSIIDPIMMLSVTPNDALNPVAEEARERLERVMIAIEAGQHSPGARGSADAPGEFDEEE